MTLQEFYTKVTATQKATGWRYGQTLFNVLYEVKPDLAQQIRGTKLDCFHRNSLAEMSELLDWIEANWEK